MFMRTHHTSALTRIIKLSLATFLLLVFCILGQLPGSAQAEEASPGVLGRIDSVSQGDSPNTVVINYHSGTKGRITFLDKEIFRFTVDPSDHFDEYATPVKPDHVARIQAQPDTSEVYTHPAASIKDTGASWQVTSGNVVLSFDKTSAKMSASVDGEQVFAEAAPLSIKDNQTSQSLVENKGENFYGGGTQNGRFTHRGQSIEIVNTNSWTDGGVSSPNPFYWSSKGYGVLRNTFAPGRYDFGESSDGTVKTTHNDGKFDAYYFVTKPESNASTAQSLLRDYFKVTGNPVLLPEFAFYLGHLNAYNRDGWSDQNGEGAMKWVIKGSEPASSEGTASYEYGRRQGYVVPSNLQAESLNGHGPSVAAQNMHPAGYARKYSAQNVIDTYAKYDMPLGWFLPNDGYGAGYGQNGFNVTGGVNADGTSSPERIAALDANVANLGEFSRYANLHGVQTGLWTQSQLTPTTNPETKWQLLRDFKKEVTVGGISALKTDVAWVGSGYSFGLNGIKTAYDTMSTTVHKRPQIVTLDGWAGTQRFGAIWTGDQYGGQWEYIRFHIPTYIGQSLSGNPNIGSDIDGIFSGSSLISVRDYQWKTFTPIMLDMDGWGSYAKTPYTHGDPYTGISRMYLKLKARLMPYIYTTAASAANIDTGNGDTGLPMVRAMFLSDPSAYAASRATQYQYMFGKDFLVAPVYQNTHADSAGNDVRDDIYLPGDKSTIWIDYFSGKQYRGGQVLNNFKAPLWKLPLFVRNGAIVPMYAENNNPSPKSEINPKGLDKTKRVIEFWPAGSSSYKLYEDDGTSINNDTTKDAKYGVLDKINYGGAVSTELSSTVTGTTATLVAKASTGSYKGYDPNRSSTFVVNVSKKPSSITMKNGQTTLTAREVSSKADFDAAKDGDSVYFYDEAPNLNPTPSTEHFSETKITSTPKLYVHFAKTNVSQNAQTLVLAGFENKAELPADTLNNKLSAPELSIPENSISDSAITVNWNAVEGATSYEIKADGTVFNMGNATSYTQSGLHFNTTHSYQVRSRNSEGYSEWSPVKQARTLEDPWRNIPSGKYSWTGGIWSNHNVGYAFDHSMGTLFHSSVMKPGEDYVKVDYTKAYELDKLEYYPREDAGNGTVTSARIWWSLDNKHWSHQDVTWQRDGNTKTFTFPRGAAARYVAISPLASVGNFFSAREIAIYKKAGSSPFEVGSNTMKPEVSESDYTNMLNYLAVEDRDPDTSTFESQIAGHHADINMNGVYDAYDYAFTMSKLDGGTKQTGAVTGRLLLVPVVTSATATDSDVAHANSTAASASAKDSTTNTTSAHASAREARGVTAEASAPVQVKAGDIVTYNLYIENPNNVNALGLLFHYKSSDWEYLKDSITQAPALIGFENLSKAKTSFSDGTQTINLAFVNRGNKPLGLLQYSGLVASFKLRSLKNQSSAAPAKSILVGPQLDEIEADIPASADLSEGTAKPSLKKYPESAFNITMTNDVLTTDDGHNVEKMTQQGTYAGLFDGTETYGSGNTIFELKWDIPQNHDSTGHLPNYVKVPSTIHFAFKQPSPLDSVEVVNRAGGNGTVQRIKAQIFFEDGTSETLSGGTYDSQQARYKFPVSKENADKKVTRVDITPLQTTNPQMLTLLETNFNYKETPDEGPEVTSISNVRSNKTTMFVDEASPVRALINPQNASQFYTVTSSHPEVANIVYTQPDGAGHPLLPFVAARKAGTTTITVTSKRSPSQSFSYELEVKDHIDTSQLKKAIQIASTVSPEIFTPDTYNAVITAVKEGESLLKSGSYTRGQIAFANAKIREALVNLEWLPANPKYLINTKANANDGTDPISVVYASSEITTPQSESGLAKNVLDYNDKTFWQSNYQTAGSFPASLIFKVQGDYKVDHITFLPRQDSVNGQIAVAEVYASDDLDALKSDKPSDKVQKLGAFQFDTVPEEFVLEHPDQFQEMVFKPSMARYFKVKVIKSFGEHPDKYASAAEFRFYGKKVVTVDKSALTKLVKEQKDLGLKPDSYTEKSWTPYENALSDAERTLADEKASQSDVDNAAKLLEEAYKALSPKASEPAPAKPESKPEHKPDTTPGAPSATKPEPGKPGAEEAAQPGAGESKQPAKPEAKPVTPQATDSGKEKESQAASKPGVSVPDTSDPSGLLAIVSTGLAGVGMVLGSRKLRK